MSKTLKISLASIALLLAIILGILPGAIGYVAQKELKKLGHSLKQRGMPFKLSEYHRHWFTSSAKLTLANNPPVNVTIYHGPVIFSHGLTFATAKIHATHHVEGYHNQLELLLAYNNSAELTTTSQTTEPKQFLPQSIRTKFSIPNVSEITSASAHVTLNKIQSNAPKATINRLDLNIDAIKKQQQWHLTGSIAINKTHIDIPNQDGHLNIDQLEINNLSIQPQQLFLQAMQLQNANHDSLDYQKLAQQLLSGLITKKTNMEVRHLHLMSADPKNKIDLSINTHFSWPNLPIKPSMLDYLKFLKGHFDLNMPVLNTDMGNRNTSLSINNLNLYSNISGFEESNNTIHLDKLDLLPEANAPLSLTGLDIKSNNSTTTNNLHNALLSVELNKACLKKDCYHNSDMKLIFDKLNQPNQSFTNLFTNINRLSKTINQLHNKLNQASASEKAPLRKQIAAIENELNNANLYYYQFFINKETKLLFRFKSTSDTGNILANAVANWPQAENHSKKRWVTSPTINASIHVPTALIKKFAPNSMKQVNILSNNRCISASGNMLSTKIHYGSDNITLNNQPLHQCLFAKENKHASRGNKDIH